MRSLFLGLSLAIFMSACSDSQPLQKLTLTGSSTVAPVASEIAKAYEKDHPGTRIEVQTGGSSRGITDADSGRADIGMVSRALKSEEAGFKFHTVAIDGVAVILNTKNGVKEFTRDQLIAIYTGKISNWKDLGGIDAEITVVNKAAGRATLEVFIKFLGLDSADIDADLIVGENQQAIKTVSGNPNAIGYVSIGAAEVEAKNGVPTKTIAVDGIAANSETVANGTYPISRPLLLITKGESSDLAKDFLNFATSKDVHPLILSQLYVPFGK